jgi:hypothetical protein
MADGRTTQLRDDLDDLYGIVGDIRTTVDAHTGTLAEHTVTLAEHSATLAEHGTVLAEHTVTLAEHGGKLDEILSILRAR